MFFIHIGQRKTGTTSLQQFFAMNAAALEAEGICYTELGRNESHRALAQSFIESRPEIADLPARIQELAHENPDKRFLISSEIFERTPPEGIEHLAKVLAPHEVRILVYVRNFADQKVSFYNQRTKSGANVLDFDTFFEREKFVRNGYENIERWSRVFGKESVRVAALDALSGDNALFKDALSMIGLSFDHIRGINPESVAPRNISYGWKVTEIYRALSAALRPGQPVGGDRRTTKRRPHKRVLLAACERIASELGFARDKTAYLTRTQADRLWSDYLDAIERLNDFICTPVEVGEKREAEERPFLPSVDHIPQQERTEFAAAFVATEDLRRRYGDQMFLCAASAISV